MGLMINLKCSDLGKTKDYPKKNLGLKLLPIQKLGLICHFKKKCGVNNG
jgi:hypothetical protein